MELIPKEALAKTRGGSYFVLDKQLKEISNESLKELSDLMEDISKEHPNLYFDIVRHVKNNGYVISWWVRDEHGTEESGDPKVLPWG
jgi:hypothetical protein